MQLSDHKAIVRLGIPIAIGQLGVIIMGFADTMMLGRYSTDALAAASFVNSVFNLGIFMLSGYGYGLTPLVASCYGRGRLRRAGGVLKEALLANLLVGLLITALLVGALCALPLFGQPTSLLPLIRLYFLPMLVSMVFVALFNALRQFTDGITDTAVGMWVMLIGNACNIVGNYLLIYGVGPFPELGLLGAGLSTLLARMLMPLLLFSLLIGRSRYRPYLLGFMAQRLHAKAVRQVHKMSMPIALQMGMESGCFTVSGIMAGWIGATDLASFQVMVTIGTLGFLLYYSFGSGVSIRMAAFYGQHNWEKVKQVARAGRDIMLLMAFISSCIIAFFGRELAGCFTTDPAVLALCVSLLPPLVLYQLGDTLQVCYSNTLRATGHVQSVMWIAFVSYVVVNIPMSYLLAFTCGLGSKGLFLAFSSGLFTAGALFFVRFRRTLRASMLETRAG